MMRVMMLIVIRFEERVDITAAAAAVVVVVLAIVGTDERVGEDAAGVRGDGKVAEGVRVDFWVSRLDWVVDRVDVELARR